MSKNNGGPAFPLHLPGYAGMLLRDYFAAMAMQGLLAAGHNARFCRNHMQSMADTSYQIADEMLEARGK